MPSIQPVRYDTKSGSYPYTLCTEWLITSGLENVDILFADFKILTFYFLLVKAVRIAQSRGGYLSREIKFPYIVKEFQHITEPEISLFSVMQRINQVRNFTCHLFNINFNIILLSARRNSNTFALRQTRPSKLHTHVPSPHYMPHASHMLFSLISSSRWYSERSKNHETFLWRQRDTNPVSLRH